MLYTGSHISKPSAAHAATTQFALMMLVVIAGYMAMTSGAYASDALGEALCKIVQLVMGKAGRGIATLAVIILGIGATLGKVSWGMAMIVTVGIAVMFNAPALANYVSGGSGGC
jgi:type IV secretory pathway VirB2 component (pilin)